MTDRRHKKAHPRGQRYPLTPKFKADMESAIERLNSDRSAIGWFGRARSELARRLGIDKSAIGKILTVQTTSALIPEISELLGIESTAPLDEDDVIAEATSLLRKLDPELRLAYLVILRKKVTE